MADTGWAVLERHCGSLQSHPGSFQLLAQVTWDSRRCHRQSPDKASRAWRGHQAGHHSSHPRFPPSQPHGYLPARGADQDLQGPADVLLELRFRDALHRVRGEGLTVGDANPPQGPKPPLGLDPATHQGSGGGWGWFFGEFSAGTRSGRGTTTGRCPATSWGPPTRARPRTPAGFKPQKRGGGQKSWSWTHRLLEVELVIKGGIGSHLLHDVHTGVGGSVRGVQRSHSPGIWWIGGGHTESASPPDLGCPG